MLKRGGLSILKRGFLIWLTLMILAFTQSLMSATASAASKQAVLIPLQEGGKYPQETNVVPPENSDWKSVADPSINGGQLWGGYQATLRDVCPKAKIGKITIHFDVSDAKPSAPDSDAIFSFATDDLGGVGQQYNTAEIDSTTGEAFANGTNWLIVRGDDTFSNKPDNGAMNYSINAGGKELALTSVAIFIQKNMNAGATGEDGLLSVTTSLPAVTIEYDDGPCAQAIIPVHDDDQDGIPADKDIDDHNACVPNPANALPSADCDGDRVNKKNDPDDSNPCIPDPRQAPATADCDGDGVPKAGDPDDQNRCIPDISKAKSTDDCDGDGTPRGVDPDDSNGCIPDIAKSPRGLDCDGDGVKKLDDIDDGDPCIPNANSAACLKAKKATGGLDNISTADANIFSKLIAVDAVTAPNPCTDPANTSKTLDCDRDGFGRSADPDDNNPCVPDIARGNSNSDCDGDGVKHADDPDDGNPCTPNKVASTDPGADCDKDGVPHALDIDDGNPCLPDPFKAPDTADCDKDGTSHKFDIVDTNSCIPDAALAGDGADCDGDKVLKKDDPDDTDPCIPDKRRDTCDFDGDGLTTGEEKRIYGTDPTRKDTDGDGISDGDEVHGDAAKGRRKSNPLNYCDPTGCTFSPPQSFLGKMWMTILALMLAIPITHIISKHLIFRNLKKKLEAKAYEPPPGRAKKQTK